MSIISRTAIAGLIVAVAVAVGGPAAFAKGNKGGGTPKPVSGTVTAVDQTSVTIDTKKLGSQKYTVNATTVYETAAKKGEAGTPAALTDVQVGEKVMIEGTTDAATKVIIAKAHKHKK